MRYTPKQLPEPTQAQIGWAIRTLREKAEELDISYHDALVLVKPDYVRSVRYGDIKFEEKTIADFDKITQETIANWDKFMKEREGK
jgi:hypothetical protein